MEIIRIKNRNIVYGLLMSMILVSCHGNDLYLNKEYTLKAGSTSQTVTLTSTVTGSGSQAGPGGNPGMNGNMGPRGGRR